jgi:hypothetical protein
MFGQVRNLRLIQRDPIRPKLEDLWQKQSTSPRYDWNHRACNEPIPFEWSGRHLHVDYGMRPSSALLTRRDCVINVTQR